MVQVPCAALAVPAALAVSGVPGAGAGPASSGAPPQPGSGAVVGRAHGGAVPARPAPGGGLASITGHRGRHGVRRTARGPGRSSPRPAPATAARGRGRVGLPPDRGWTCRSRDPALRRPRLDDRAAGSGRTRAGADRRPADVVGDGAAAAARAARGMDDRGPPRRRGGRAGDPDARLHRGPAGRTDPGSGGDHVAGARCATAAAGQDRGRSRARCASCHRSRAGSPTCTTPSRPWTSTPRNAPAADRLERDLDSQLERAATRAFRNSFLIGAGLALLALLTVVVPGPRSSR